MRLGGGRQVRAGFALFMVLILFSLGRVGAAETGPGAEEVAGKENEDD